LLIPLLLHDNRARRERAISRGSGISRQTGVSLIVRELHRGLFFQMSASLIRHGRDIYQASASGRGAVLPREYAQENYMFLLVKGFTYRASQ
jgi:hypothetical protein